MVKRLLISLTIVITFSFVIPHFNPTHAQSLRSSDGYVEMMKALLLRLNPAIGTRLNRKPHVTPTPTIYVQATPTPTKAVTQVTPTPTKATTFPTSTPTPTATPTQKPQPTPTPTKTATPTPAPTTGQSNDVTSYIMSEINAYRSSLSLSSVSTSQETCDFAAIRAKEIVNGFNHDGFTTRVNAKTLPYASWTKVTENIAMTSNYKDVATMWKNSPGHAANMRADTPFVCVKQSGNYYAYEGMKP